MSRKRTRNDVGYTHNSFLSVTPAAVVSNARLRYHDAKSLRELNQNPLFPHAKIDNPKYLPARKGVIAFTLASPENRNLKELIGPHMLVNNYSRVGSYDPELDSIPYFSMLNSLGDKSVVAHFGDVAHAQKSFLNCIRPIGIIVSDVENASNLSHHSNTLMHSFGKMTIPNLGCEDIQQGASISADLPTERDYKNYGYCKIDSFEPDCFTLVPVPTRTMENSIESIKSNLLNQFRNKTHEDAVLQLVRGALTIAAPIQAIAFAGNNLPHLNRNALDTTRPNLASTTGMTTAQMDAQVHDTSNSLIQQQTNVIHAYHQALLGIDEEYDSAFIQSVEEAKIWSVKNPSTIHNACYPSSAVYPDYNVRAQNKQILSDSLSDVMRIHDNNGSYLGPSSKLGPVFVNDATKELINSSFSIDRGVHDLITGLSQILYVSASFKVGTAVTPASVGKDFDLVISVQ